MKKTLLLTLFISGCFSMVKAQQLAFPGAEGFGKSGTAPKKAY